MSKISRNYSFIFLTLIFSCSSLSFAQINSDNNLICEDPSSSMLWKVESKNDDAVSEVYLFGSLHIGKENFYPLPEIIEKSFRGAQHLVFEVNPDSANDPALGLQMQTRGMFPLGQSLKDVVSPDVITSLRQTLKKIGLPEDSLMGMRPWFLTLILSNLQINSMGYSSDFGLESYLLSQKTPETDVLELESIEDQLDVLELLNSETYLVYSLQSFDEGGTEEIETMIEAWQCADKEVLANMLFDDFSDDDELSVEEISDLEYFQEVLFYERNITMAAGVESFIENGRGRYFVVVGSGHLLGERSVISLLRDEGYQINPVLLPVKY